MTATNFAQCLYCECLRPVFQIPSFQLSRSFMEFSSRAYHVVSRRHNKGCMARLIISPRVIEINVGTICACLPHLATFYRHHFSKYDKVAAIKTFTSRINPFRLGKKSAEHRLGTHILGSARGEGKFLKSDDFSNATTLTTATASSMETKG